MLYIQIISLFLTLEIHYSIIILLFFMNFILRIYSEIYTTLLFYIILHAGDS